MLLCAIIQNNRSNRSQTGSETVISNFHNNYLNNTDSQNENFFFLHEQISNFLKGHDLLVTNRPQKNFTRV